MKNLLFSLNAIAPIFLIIFLGYFLKKRNIINENFTAISTNLVFKAALPALLFEDIAKTDFTTVFDIKLILFAVSGTILYSMILFAICSLSIKEKKARGAFIQGAFRSNFAILGTALALSLFGQQGLVKSAILLAFTIPLYNILSIIVLTCTCPDTSGNNMREILLNIIKNPLIIAIVIALPFSYFNIQLPEIASKTIDYMSSLAIPLALLSMGGSFNFSAARKNLLLGLIASFIKIVASPLIFISAAYFMGFRNTDLGVLFLIFATPAALTSYVMARAMGSDSDLAANIIMITTLGSMFTIMLGIYALKVFGAI